MNFSEIFLLNIIISISIKLKRYSFAKMSYLNFREINLALRLSDENILQSFAAIKKIVNFMKLL